MEITAATDETLIAQGLSSEYKIARELAKRLAEALEALDDAVGEL